MKLQIQGQSIRIRLGEDELARLLDGHALVECTSTPVGTWAWQLVLAPLAALDRGGPTGVRLAVPEAAFRAFAAERPRRDGLVLDFPTDADDAGGLEISLEVDVRESRRKQVADASST